jgi:hypothetical protein
MKAWILGFCALGVATATIVAQNGVETKSDTASAPTIKIEPLKLDFGSLATGTSSQPMTSTLTNSGSSTVKIVDITPSGIDFTETNTCADTLVAGATCQIQVTFKPVITGTRLGVVSVMTSVSGRPSYIVLTGVGL